MKEEREKKNNNNMETETVYSAVHVSSCDAVLFATRNFREKNDKEKKKNTFTFSERSCHPRETTLQSLYWLV